MRTVFNPTMAAGFKASSQLADGVHTSVGSCRCLTRELGSLLQVKMDLHLLGKVKHDILLFDYVAQPFSNISSL